MLTELCFHSFRCVYSVLGQITSTHLVKMDPEAKAAHMQAQREHKARNPPFKSRKRDKEEEQRGVWGGRPTHDRDSDKWGREKENGQAVSRQHNGERREKHQDAARRLKATHPVSEEFQNASGGDSSGASDKGESSKSSSREVIPVKGGPSVHPLHKGFGLLDSVHKEGQVWASPLGQRVGGGSRDVSPFHGEGATGNTMPPLPGERPSFPSSRWKIHCEV